MQLKLLKPFSSKTMFRGHEFDLKFCTTPKEKHWITQAFLFSDKVLAAYREIEIYLHIHFSFWIMQKMQNFRSNLRPLNSGLENLDVDVGIAIFIYKYSWIVYNNTMVNLKESTNTT